MFFSKPNSPDRRAADSGRDTSLLCFQIVFDARSPDLMGIGRLYERQLCLQAGLPGDAQVFNAGYAQDSETRLAGGDATLTAAISRGERGGGEVRPLAWSW